MANNDKISKMYNALVKSGYNMASEEVFRQRMSDPNKRKAAYDALKKSGYNMRPYDEFEANIGYGEAETAPAQTTAPTASTSPAVTPSTSTPQTSTPAPATTPETASVPAQQERWQPTEQEKIQMHRLHTMMNDFNQRSKARVEQTRRMTERFTPEGRKKLKAAKFQAQLAGTPTSVMGLTPYVSAAPADGQQGATYGAEAPKPLLSGQSPVPYGVVIENGERKTQWLLPDGRLTTSLIEADQAEYGARRVRLMNQFVRRMKANGLDPSKQEDVQRQAQLDYEAPMRKVLDSVWAQAEAEDRAADEEYTREMKGYNKTIRSNIRAFDPDGMPLPTPEVNLRDYNRAVKRKETFNLESMANTVLNSLPSSYRQQTLYAYQQYFTAHTNELNGRSVQQAAEDALRAEVYNAVYQRAVDYQMPKSKTEFLMRKIADQPLLSPYMAMDMAAASMTHSWGMNAAEVDAMGQYGQQHRALDITGTVLNMAFDPTTYVSGGVGGFVGKQGIKLAGKQMIKGASKELAERYAARTLTGRVIGGVAGGAANFAIYEALKNIQGQMAVGGVVNPETGEREFSFDEVLKAGGHGLVLGGVTGAFSPIIGNVADKYVKATTSTAGKMAVRTGELATSTLAEGTIFSAYDIYENSKLAADDPNKRSNWDIWSDSMAMMLGFKVSHMVKSAPQYVASLRPIKPTNGRPLTQAERNHNRMDFEERLRKRMDMSPRDLDFTKDERDELRKKGYGELSDLFTRSEKPTEAATETKPEDGADDFPRAEAEELGRNPEFDGYEAMERLMQDKNVSQATRAKAYFILTGRMLPMATITGYTTEQDADGFTIVNSVGRDGEVITSRRFASERKAQGEIDNINRQAELNTIDVGERYRDAEANEAVFMAAVNEVSRGADPQAIRQIYEAVKRGDENVTESQRQLVEFLDEAIKRNSEAGAEHRPEAIRERLNKETGLDVDKALRKQPKDRTEEEQALAERYARELFPEQKQEEQYEPSPEQAEADRMYEESRLLYGRFEQGDPTAQADIDAIVLRMQEAYQMCEDAFGAEAEYWMYHVNENPWSLINDPAITRDQQEAVLYYINSKAALDGVMDASHEASQRKREQVEQEVAGRTHKERGVIIPAVLKVDDKPAYIIKGDVAMYTDGSGIDAAHSSESIVIMDESGEYKFATPDQIYKVGESIDPQDELQTAYAQIDAEQESVFGVDVPPEPEAPAEPAPEPAAPAPEAEAPQQPIVDTKEYDRGFEDGIEVSKSLSDDVLNEAITDLRGREFLTDEWRGRLEAYEYEQQRRQMEPQNAPAEAAGNNDTENIPQNGNITPENIPQTENPAPNAQPEQPQSALSRIPFNEEKQDYEFTAVEPETAWDGLVEAMEGEANAVPIAQQMIEDANKRLEALGKKPPTPAKPKLAGKAGPMAMRAEQKRVDEANAKAQAEYQQALADAQAEAQAWSNILRVYTDRNAELRRQQEEERRRRDAEAHDAAVARFEEEQRIKAEKQAEQERIGVHAVNPKIRERWEVAPKVEGNEDALTLPDGSTITGRYVLTEAGAASPSHDANNAYAPTEGFPIDENGQSVNDRDYQRDKDAQRIVENIAGSYDNRALQDPVIVSKDGVVLSGNNRTMSGDLAARQGTDKAYNDYLAKFGHKKFGFTPEQVQGMKNPRVVFVPDEALPYDATTFARFNAQEKKSQGKPEAAVKLGKIVPDAVFNNIVNDISRYDRLSDYYADEKAVAQALGALMQAGVINDKQMPELRTGTALSAGGKELLENTLIGKVFQASPDAVRQIISVPTLRQAIVMGLSEIANNRTLSRNGYDLADELAKAVDLVQRAKSSNPDIYVEGMPVSPFGRQAGLFDDEFGDSRVTDATTLLLAYILNSGKPSDLRKVLATYNNEASMSASGQADIFTGEIASKEDILTQVNKIFRNATPKEQQALVDAAIAERKRRAEAEAEQRGRDQESEQTPNGAERGAEPQQLAAGAEDELTPEEQALVARVEVTDNEWTEGEGDKPTYKREIIIDGTHKATQVDAPDEGGHYTGSYFEFDGKRFGDIAEIAQYIDGGMKSEPTEAQKAAGNYKMEHRRVDGYNVSIENPKGSVRRGKTVDAEGKETPWETTMQNDYGYIRGTQGVDGDHIDVFLSDTPEQGDVFVIDQLDKDGSFDEHKVMYGFPSVEAAREAYLSNYEPGWTGLGAITHVSKDEFKKWIGSSKRKTKPFAEYKSVKVYREQNPQLTIEPDGFSDFGPVFTQFKGDAQGAIKLLSELQDGEAIGALHHKDIGDIDLVWGNAGTAKSDGFGLAKLVKFHPEVVKHLQEILDDMHIVNRSENRINLESDIHKAAVRLTWNREKKKWLLTAFEKKETPKSIVKTTDTGDNPTDLRGGTALSQNSGVSDGKVNTLSADKQTDGAESSEPYTITPAVYVGKPRGNKPGKETPMHRVTFNRPLTAEQERAVKSFANEAIGEKKGRFATKRGLADREASDGSWLFRTEEDARKAGEMIGNEEAIADAQPMTAEELREAVAPAPAPAESETLVGKEYQIKDRSGVYRVTAVDSNKKRITLTDTFGGNKIELEQKAFDMMLSRNDIKPYSKPARPKKAPINRVSLEDVMNDLSTKGETKLSDHAEPVKAEPEAQHEISDDEMQSLANELRDLLGIGEDEGDADIKFREPGELTPQERQRIQSAGIRMAMGLVERGTTSFPDYATKMVGLLGDKIRPWLKSFYEGARWTPGYENIAFTPSEEVARFDVQNFDKPQADPIAQAVMIVEERKASTASEQAQKELTEIRNNKRKKQDEQTATNTAALAEKAEAVASEAEKHASLAGGRKPERKTILRDLKQIDDTLDEVNSQLALLGYYEAEEDDSKFHESYGYMLTAEKKAVADATKLAKQLVNDLGIDIKVTSATTPLGRKSVKKGTAVRANLAPAGGDVMINLPLNEGRELYINIGLEPADKQEGDAHNRPYYRDDLNVRGIMYRVEWPDEKGHTSIERMGRNRWADDKVTYGDLLNAIRREAKDYLPTAEAAEPQTNKGEEAYHGIITLKDGREAVVVAANHVHNIGEPSRLTDYIVGVKGEPGTIKIKPDEIAHAGAPTKENRVDAFPDPKDKEAVSTWLYDNSDEMWRGVDAMMKDAVHDEQIINTFKAKNTEWAMETIVGEFVDRWLSKRLEEMFNEYPATIKAWFDYGQRGLISNVMAERIAKAIKNPAEAPKEKIVNGYKVGDEVMLERNGKWEKQRIVDFDANDRPILDSFGTSFITEVADWSRVKPANGIFGEAQRVARAEQEKKKSAPAKKKTAVKPEQPVADLFGGLFDEPISDEKKTDVQPRPGTAERERGHEPQPNEPLGESQRNETERTDGRGMGGRDSVNPMSDGERGAGVSRKPASREPLERLPEAERKNSNNNHAERGTDYAPKGEDARIKANIEAIELAKRLLEAGEQATPEQMAVLRRFSGWGGLGKAFKEKVSSGDSGYDPRLRYDYQPANPINARLRELLSPEAYEAANMSRNSAYYTPAEVIDTMWDVVRAMGFKGGNVLEGSAGIGNILGLMPIDLSDRSSIHAVEIDRTTGGILSLLYPDAKVDVQGFEKTKIRNNTIDLAITNVPFVTGLRVMDETGDKDLSKKFRDIHDFCIAKNIRKLREGGIGIFITSSGTMDNSKELRRWIINEGNADVVGAFRMHNKTFGGTGATSDIIVVRKRVNGKPSPNAIDVTDVAGVRVADYDTGETRKVKGQEIPIVNRLTMDYNKYFAEHPENMAGEMRFGFEEGDTFRPKSKALYPVKGKEQSEMLTEWAGRFADMEEEAAATPNVEDEVTRINEQLGEGVKEGSMVLNSQGELCMARMGEAVPLGLNKNKVKGHTKAECFNAYTAIKKALSDVLEYQSSHEGDEGLAPLLKELNRAFDTFTRTYGNLHKNTAISFLRNDVDFSSILALETYSEKGDKKGNKVVKVGKTDIFSRRVIETEKEPQPTTIKDGILTSLYKSGGIDVDYIGQALGKSTEDVKREIVESGLGFENPSTGAMEVSYKYLSGNVREKLHIAQENNEGGRYDANIKALENVMPMTIPAHLIEFALGSSWIEPKLYEDFVYEKTGIRVTLTNAGGTWFMKTPWNTFNEKNRAMAVVSKMCDETIMGHELIESAITNKQITVSKTERHYDGTTETITDKVATAECGTKVDEIRAEFKDWAREHMQADPEMSARIERTYNEQFNNYVPMSIPDEFVPQHFGGQVSELHGRPFALRPHQGRAVVRGTTEPILLAHEVGTGKTYTLITTAMEMRRLGTARKPMIVVQNATVGQFVESAKEIYPNAKVLTIEDADRTAEGRRNFYAKIKYNDWDMIVVPQSVFERIPDSPEREMAYVKDIIDEKMKVLEAMREADSDGRSMIVRQAERELAEQEERLAELTEAMQGRKKKRDEKKEATTRQNAEVKALEMLDREVDDVENFDDMGIDAILVDEAHEYKHLGFATAMQRGVKGVDPSFSKKSQGVFLKAQAVMERNNGRNVVFATGTPISNTAAEIWTFMRYLMPVDTMKSYGIYYFDDFVRNFGNIAQMVEFATNGKFKENNRFAGYVNLPELVRIWSSVADTVLTREAGGVSDKIPDMEGGKPQDIYLPQTRALRSVMKFVKAQLDQYDKMTGKEKKENSHIPLTMYGIAKAAAVDVRLVVPNAEDDPNSKTNATVRETLRSLKDSEKYKGTVAIFSDNYQNNQSGFNLYEDIRTKLIAEGVPADQIVVIKSGMTVKKKLDIFEKVNAGEIRVIMGSTFTLGTGVNIQERLHTLIHVDAPNRPMDYTQRNGRALRQGNLHKDMGIPVRIIRFGVEDSLDVTAYQRLKTKGAIADSIMNGSKMMQNSMENRVLEEEEDSFGDMTAQLSGSEYAILKNQAEREVRSLTAKQKGHDIDQIYVHNQLPKVEGFIKGAERRIELETKNLEIIGRHFPDGSIKKITIGKLSFENVAAMEDFFKEQNAKMNEAAEAIREGADNYTSRLTVDVDGLQFEITTTVGRAVDKNGQGTLTFEPERNVTYSCEALGIKDEAVKGNRIKNVMQRIAEDIATGNSSRELLNRGQQQLAHYSEEYRLLQERNGREFPYKAQLAEAKERLAKYEEAMRKELEEKEAKYAEMDKSVDAASDIALTDEDSEDTPTNGDGNKYRLIEERGLLDFLDGQPLKLGYRYSQWANMGVLPPMTAKQNGEWRAPMVFSRWEQSEEGMRKENGKADLVQGNGRTTGDVAYNPYFHIRTSPLNDQFTAAYDRPELIVVEGYYPESEETSGYHAEGAKDSVGLMDWHSGSVNGQLSEDTKVQTMLSRYFKPGRIVPWSEVADLIMERVGDQKITFPINAVPPMLRAELAKRGAKFGDISGSVADADIPMLNELRDRVNSGEWDAGLEKAREYIDAYESSPEAKEARVANLSAVSHTPVRVIRTQAEVDALPTRRERRAKGWWSAKDNEVVIVLPNNVNVADVDNTFVHEVAGHKGLRAFIGEERFDEFLGEVYDHASNPIRKVIDKKTDDMVNAEADRLRVRKAQAHERAGEDVNSNYYTDMAEARVEAEAKREEFRKEATEEYMSDLGGRIGSEGFEKMSRDELSLWGKIKAKVQSFLDKFLRGLKIAKSIRLNDKDLSYILFKSWKNMRDRQGKGGVFADAEDAVMRRRTGYDADNVTRFRDPDMSLEETITKMKAEIMQANTDNLQAKRDAMRAIGGNLNHLRQAMARQREYDITTVKSVTDLAKILMDAGLLDDMSKFETKRILGAVNNVVGRQDVSQYVQKVMDIMVDNQLRNGAGAFGQLLAIRGSRVDARGIEVQGELDPGGQRIAQVVRKSTSLPKDDIDNRIAEATNRMSSTDQAIADEATLEYAGLQIARQYVEDITESKAEEKALRDSIKQAKEDKDAGQMTDDAYKQYVESTNDAIRQNKIERAEAYQSLIEQMGDALSASVERAKAWREAEKQRVEEIHHNANSDMEGRPTDEHHKDDRVQKLSNNSFVRFMLAPLGTFDQMLRMFGKKNVRGEGYLWNRYMRGWVEAAEKEYTGYRDALKVLDAKVSEIYGKKMTWGDLFAIDRKLPKASVRFWDGGEMKDHELTQGNLLYIYMADKMSDGRMKLRRMGITEDDIENIKNFLDPKFLQLADWMQEEFLVGKRNEYNEVHKRMFGASMAAIENYFPLKILANARLENVDVADDTTDTALPATSTGSIIKRRRNNLALDVTGANAFSVILDHLQQMERWAAFAEFNRDLNTLLSYKRFRNQVMNMSSVYGGGKTLWTNLRNVCSMAAGAYRPPIAALDKAAVNIAKGVTAAKVSFRVFTALKQFLSMPAYLSDSNPLYLAADIANPIGAWKWSMENLPLFEKRWKSRMAGDPRLLKSEMDWKMWRSRVVEIASRVGMSPNAFVDALTVAIGAHSMYQTKLAKYKRYGYDSDVAEERAKQDATILFNQTQQSSEGAFLSTMQVDRSWLSVLFTVFRNSPMSYSRQLYDSLRNLKRYMTPGNKALSVEFMAKQMWRDGIDPDKADINAKREYRRNIIRDLARVAVFGFALQFAWNLGAYLPYILMGEDDSEKDKMWDDVLNHTYFGSIEGLTGGDVMSSAGQMWLNGEGNWEYLAKDMPLASDLATILRKMPNDQKAAVNDILNLLVQSGVGVNPQSLTDIVVATMDYFGDDAQTSREFGLLMARIINCPQSQIDKLYFDELAASAEEASKMTPSQIAERYARYKIRRGAPLTGWAYGSEEREQIMEKYRKRSNTLAKERLTRVTDKAVSDSLKTWDEEYKATKDRVSAIRKVRERDEDRYYEMLDELEATPEFDRYQIITDYKRDVDELTKEWLRAKTPEQRDSCAKAIVNLKKLMITDLRNTQQ